MLLQGTRTCIILLCFSSHEQLEGLEVKQLGYKVVPIQVDSLCRQRISLLYHHSSPISFPFKQVIFLFMLHQLDPGGLVMHLCE